MTVAAPDSDPAEHRLDQAAVAWTLTPRQAEVLAQVVAGRANKEIANQLGCAENTVGSTSRGSCARPTSRRAAS